jgi:hypothetical protein
MSGTVERSDLVEDLCFITHGAETMKKSWRNPKLFPILRRKLDRKVAAEGVGALPDVYGYVQNGAPRHTNKLSLGLRVSLEVQSPQNAAPQRRRMIILNEMDGSSLLLEEVLPEDLRKEPSLIPVSRWSQDEQSWDWCRFDIHENTGTRIEGRKAPMVLAKSTLVVLEDRI